MATIVSSFEEISQLATDALTAAGASRAAAMSLARAIAAAERDGVASHGLAYLPTYCLHLQCGKVDPAAVPSVEANGASVRVDARNGFAHPAINLGFDALVPLARRNNIAALAVTNSYNCGVLSYHTERLAEAGLVGMGFTNAPASIAGWGGRKPVLGTNPWSLAVPDGTGGTAILIDQSASVVAKSEVMKHEREGKPLPDGWALDAGGSPTNDATQALKGTMMPSGGYKGVGSALLVEIFAACLTGATPGVEAAPFSGPAGGPPATGQFFIAIDPAWSSAGGFSQRLATVLAAFAESEGARIPGARRMAARQKNLADGIPVDKSVYDKAMVLAGRQ